MKAPATGGASLRDWVDAARARLAELEAGFTIEMAKVEAMKARLTTQTPAFLDETVRRHVEGLEKEAAMLEREAEELAKEIEELTGETIPGIG